MTKPWESAYTDEDYRRLRAEGHCHETSLNFKAVFHPPRWPRVVDDGKTVLLPDRNDEPEGLKEFLKAHRLVRVNSHYVPFNSFVIRFRDEDHAARFRMFWPGETELPNVKSS